MCLNVFLVGIVKGATESTMRGEYIDYKNVLPKVLYGYPQREAVYKVSPFELMYGKAARILELNMTTNSVDDESREV